jgi:hypothetical protein
MARQAFQPGVGAIVIAGVIVAPVNVIVGSSAIIDIKRQAQTRLAVDDVRIVDSVADILAGSILIGAGPDLRRRPPARGVTKPVILFELGQRSAEGPSPCCARHPVGGRERR